jgi:PAS domain S-box-containing protein
MENPIIDLGLGGPEHVEGAIRDRNMGDARYTKVLIEMNAVTLTEVLEQDSRPTFVIDLDPDLDIAITPDMLSPIFCNIALRSYDRLLEVVGGETTIESTDTSAATYADFIAWARSVTRHDDSMDIFPLSFLYSGMLWTGSTLRKRWRLISGNKCYQTSSLTSGDLSSGPPSEVATGGLVAQMSEIASSGKDVRLNKSTNGQGATSRVKISGMSAGSTHSRGETKLASVGITNKPRPSRNSDIHGSSWNSLDVDSTPSVVLEVPESVLPDWTVAQPKGDVSPHLQFCRSIDWESTALGPMSKWSRELRQIANLLMSEPHPAAVFWGNDLNMMYNEAYSVQVAGRKHPDLMGTGFRGPFAELWETVYPIFNECAKTGRAIAMDNQMLPIERHGFLEETYFSWSLTPLFGGTTRVLGFYNAPFETTREQIGNRRLKTLRKLGEQVTSARTVKAFWAKVLEGLEDNHFDVPFALLYSVIDVDDGENSSHSSSGSSMSMKSCVFEGGLGIPAGHPAAPPQLDLKRSREGFIPSFREAMRTREPTKLQTTDSTLPESLLEGIQWRGFGEPCREAMICPVRPTNGENVLGFLLLGVNPRRPYDEDYESFMNMLNRQLATSLASIILYEEEIRRGRTAAEAAAIEQEHLTDQLAVQTSRLQRIYTLSPVGLFYISPEGVLLEGNDRWFELIGHPKDNMQQYSWLEFIMEEYHPLVEAGWKKLAIEGVPWSAEVRLKKRWVDPVTGESSDFWILGSAHPEYAANGELRSVMGSVTDISHVKWGEAMQSRRLREAEETRRQQNEFIDITSHEMRNPLSAILQCADDVAASLGEYQTEDPNLAQIPASVLESCIDAANTIVLCAQHQKCIVDDILTISKLDSNLLLITPVVVQPIAVAQRAVKMFDAELQKKDIKIDFCIQNSVHKLGIDWAVLDPSRLLQVLINLLTNAIKFTQDQPTRLITVRIAASLDPPPEQASGFEYIPHKSVEPTITSFNDDWGSGEPLYLQFEVQDTGKGLTVDEKKLLFMRFSQASPRTHAQYGGSGLGLFISRQLTELHGGQIGVGSEAGVGSTFAFYIQARRSVSRDNNQLPMASPVDPDWQGNSYISQLVKSGDPYTSNPGNISPVRSISASEKTPKAPKHYHILVVEDNLVNQKVMSKQLSKSGCTVAVASHGLEALQYLERTVFWAGSKSTGNQSTGNESAGEPLSVILMDLEMPVMDGLTCVRKIREMEREGILVGHVPVIAVTANVRMEQVEKARECGMDDVLSKPFRIPELIEKIELILGTKV